MILQPTDDVTHIQYSDVLMFSVNEIFHSIQGEGTRAGERCVFVRLQGCKLRCVWCDTKYAIDHRYGGIPMTAGEIVAVIESYDCRFVEFTGGEPLEQFNVFPLMKHLCDEGFMVAIETGGHISTQYVDPRVIAIIDVKCPDSKMSSLNYWTNLERLRSHDEVKFVIASREDYDYAKDVIGKYQLGLQANAVLFSPSFNDISVQALAEMILADRLPVRMQVQMHKYIWHPETRGV